MGSIPITRLNTVARQDVIAAVAQLVERVLGKDEVMGSSPISSSVQIRQGRDGRDSVAVLKYK